MTPEHQVATIERAGAFDAGWFRWRYPEIDEARGALLDYFVRHSRDELLDPSGDFDTGFYLAVTPSARNSALCPLVHHLVHPECHQIHPRGLQSEIDSLHNLMVGPSEDAARDRLVEIAEDKDYPGDQRARAAYRLAPWLALAGKGAQALHLLEAAQSLPLTSQNAARVASTRATIHARLGQGAEAYHAFTHAAQSQDNSATIGQAIMATSDHETLEHLNSAFQSAGLATLGKCDEGQPLSLLNLCGVAVKPPVKDCGLVSVIVPAFNAEDSLEIALQSLLAQSYGNLDIILVDDGSSDRTADIAEGLAAQDRRLTVLRSDKNQGAYAARNLGFSHAQGDYVTTHDADDWSHPDKIAVQVASLHEARDVRATLTYWTRTDRGLSTLTNWLPHGMPVQINHSSFMARRRDILALGGWEEIPVAADSEFIARFEAAYGAENIIALLPDVPLSFAAPGAGSLTSRVQTHAMSKFWGLRRALTEISYFWIEQGILSRNDPGNSARAAMLSTQFDPVGGQSLRPEEVVQIDLADPEAISAMSRRLTSTDASSTVWLCHCPKSSTARPIPLKSRFFCHLAGFLLANPQVRLLNEMPQGSA